MATLSYDGRTLILDGRRLWLVAAGFDYALHHPSSWRSHLARLREAGFNTILCRCHWNRHEQTPGRFNFDGSQNLRFFVQLCADMGLFVLLRPGPFVGSTFDLGSMPAWLTKVPQLKWRQADEPFLEAVSRYYSAVMGQVRDLQANHSSPGSDSTGPVLLIQAEHRRHSHHREHGHNYLTEIVRYLREAGCIVPIVTCNHFWQPIEGTIEAWDGWDHLASDLRQLRLVQPQSPALVLDVLAPNEPPTVHQLNAHAESKPSPKTRRKQIDQWVHRLAAITASCGQFCLTEFQASLLDGLTNGRITPPAVSNHNHKRPPTGRLSAQAAHLTTQQPGIDVAGNPTELFPAVRRIAVFASAFGAVLANADPSSGHAAVSFDQQPETISICEMRGSQGYFVFIFRPAGDTTKRVTLLLGEGLNLPVELGDEPVCWVGGQINLGGKAELTFTNLSPWTWIHGNTLVLFGPAGTEGLISIDQTDYAVTVPKAGRPPRLISAGNVNLLVINSQQVDQSLLDPTGFWSGTTSLDESGSPVTDTAQQTQAWQLTPEGELLTVACQKVRNTRSSLRLQWSGVVCDDTVLAAAANALPVDAEDQDEDRSAGYRWLAIESAKPVKGQAVLPTGDCRLSLFRDHRRVAVMGATPEGDRGPVELSLSGTVYGLFDQLGRAVDDWSLCEINRPDADELKMVKAVTTGKPSVGGAVNADPFDLSGYWPTLRQGQRLRGPVVTLSFKCAAGQGILVEPATLPGTAMLLINDTPVDLLDPHWSPTPLRRLIPPELLIDRKPNHLSLAFFSAELSEESALEAGRSARIWQSVQSLGRSEGVKVLPWQPPDEEAFDEGMKADPKGSGLPAWWRTTFTTPAGKRAMELTITGMTRGAVLLNRAPLCRYDLMRKQEGRGEGKQTIIIEPGRLKADKPNELLIFDEYGASTQRCTLKTMPTAQSRPSPGR